MLLSSLFFSFAHGIQYPLTADPIDVVIPCHQKTCPYWICASKAFEKMGKIWELCYVISKIRLTDKAEWVDESIFPFTKATVNKRIIGEGKLSKILHSYSGNSLGGCISNC